MIVMYTVFVPFIFCSKYLVNANLYNDIRINTNPGSFRTALNKNPPYDGFYLSTILNDVSALRTRLNPLIEKFTIQMQGYLMKNPEKSVVFNVSNLTGTQASEIFRNGLISYMISYGNPFAYRVAEDSSATVESTFDSLSPSDLQAVLGNVFGEWLLDIGLLSEDSISLLAYTAASSVWTNAGLVKNGDCESYFWALVNACETFFARLGFSFQSLLPKLNPIWVRELKFLANSSSA